MATSSINISLEEIFPLTNAQQGLLLYSHLSSNSNFYLEQIKVRLDGKLNPQIFQQAWEELIRLHPILRTVFDWNQGDNPVQIVLKNTSPDWEYFDYSLDKNKEDHWKSLCQNEEKKLFDLDIETPLRLKLIKFSNETYKFLMTYHHIILDGGSISIIFKDLETIYNDLIQGEKFEDIYRLSFKDYVEWLHTQDYQKASSFWKQYFNTFPKNFIDSHVTNKFSQEDKDDVVNTFDEIVISEDITNTFRNQCKSLGLTPSNVLQAIWAYVLCTSIKTNKIILGIPTSVRPPNENYQTIAGLCINTLPVYFHLKENQSMLELAKDTQDTWSHILEYTYLPLGEIKKVAEYNSFEDPFFSLFTYSWKPKQSEPKLQNVAWTLENHDEFTQYPLSTDAVLSEKNLIIKITYHANIFNQFEIKSMLQLYKDTLLQFNRDQHTKLDGVISNNDEPTSKHPINFMQTKSTTFSTKIDQVKLDRIIEVWRGIFYTDIHEDTNFFKIGGDSITSLRLISKLKQLGYQFTIQDIFNNPTPLALALLEEVNHQQSKKINHKEMYPAAIQESISQKYDGEVEKILPTSNIQQGLLNSPQNDKGLYHDQSTFTYKGIIDKDVFERSWNNVIQRNPSLRTAFYFTNDNWYQVILKNRPIKLSYIDLSNITSQDQQDEIEINIRKDRENEYFLENDPLIRISLFKTSDDTYIFFLTFHVLIMDGWCFALVLKEFIDEYESLIDNKKFLIQKRPSYEEYISWYLKQDLNKAKSYWKTYLPTIPKPNLPREIKKNNKKIYEIKILEKMLPQSIANKIFNSSTKHEVTINTIVQTGWANVLAKYSTNKTILFGSTVAGRPPIIEGYDQIIGLFFNDVPVRVSIESNETIWETASRIQNDFQESKNYEYISSYEIKQFVGLKKYDDLFQTLLVYENYPKYEESELKSQKRSHFINTAYWRRDMSDIDLTVYVEVFDEGIHIKMSYLTPILSEELIKTLLTQFSEELKKFTD